MTTEELPLCILGEFLVIYRTQSPISIASGSACITFTCGRDYFYSWPMLTYTYSNDSFLFRSSVIMLYTVAFSFITCFTIHDIPQSGNNFLHCSIFRFLNTFLFCFCSNKHFSKHQFIFVAIREYYHIMLVIFSGISSNFQNGMQYSRNS